MGTRLARKIHESGEGAVKPGGYVFVPKVGTEERIMDFLKNYTGGEEVLVVVVAGGGGCGGGGGCQCGEEVVKMRRG